MSREEKRSGENRRWEQREKIEEERQKREVRFHCAESGIRAPLVGSVIILSYLLPISIGSGIVVQGHSRTLLHRRASKEKRSETKGRDSKHKYVFGKWLWGDRKTQNTKVCENGKDAHQNIIDHGLWHASPIFVSKSCRTKQDLKLSIRPNSCLQNTPLNVSSINHNDMFL